MGGVPTPLDPETDLALDQALRAWQWMDNRIDWAAMPVVAEIFGITNFEAFLARLMAVRDYTRRKHG